MAKKIEETPSNSTFPPAPVFFADQPAALMLGPHVCRITFGVEEMDDGEFPRPVVTVAMPTMALLQFVNDVKQALDSASFKKQTIAALGKAAKTIAAGNVATATDRFIELKPAAKTRTRRLK